MNKRDQLDENATAQECARAAARILDSVTKTAQMSSWATPQIQDMFMEWLEIIGRQGIRDMDIPGRLDVGSKAKEIGVSGSTLLGLLLYLQRRGSISIKDVGIEKGSGCSEDICSCNRE